LKLRTKLTLFNTISKLVIVVLFVSLLPVLIKNININYTDTRLRKQRDEVLQTVKDVGIKYYIEDGKSYAGYTPIKDVYVSLDEDTTDENLDNIKNEARKVEADTIQYRILSHDFKADNKKYLLEIGISLDTVNERTSPLQSIAFVVLIVMVILTIIADQVYSDYILRPLALIIKTKLVGQKFPNFGSYKEVKTSTDDFRSLDLSIHEMIQTIESTFQKEREFISNASHELMTPISIMQSKIENLFEEENIADELKVRLLEMQRILNRLKSITKTLLLISQIENDQFLKEDNIRISSLLGEVYDEISIRLQDKNIDLKLVIPNDFELIRVNKFLLFNLFFNLINNAIKYNREDGEIRIEALFENNKFVVKVIDSGIGISPENLPFIFNRFKKIKQSLQQDSFGLGLPIVKSIADFHSIRIDVESKKDVGSTFKLVFSSASVKI
jgi:two-component system sensor histidine kinase ArlS